MPKLTAAGVSLNYRIDGPEGAPWITFATGLTNDLTMWDPHIAVLGRTHRLLRFDTRGHGDSAVPSGPYTLDQLIGDIVGLWDGLGITRSCLVGIGLGGVVAMALARAHPDRLEALVPVACRAALAPGYRAIWPPMLEAARRGGIAEIVEPTLQRWFPDAFRAANPDIIDRVQAMILRTPVEGYAGCVAALLERDHRDRLGAIRTPTLFVSGARDHAGAPPEVMREMASAVPAARHVSLPDAGHICNIANPRAFESALTEFLHSA